MIELGTHIQSQVNIGNKHIQVIWDADSVSGTYVTYRSGVLVLVESLVAKNGVARGFAGEVFVLPESRCVIALTRE